MNLLKVANRYPGSGKYLRSLRPGARKRATVQQYLTHVRSISKLAVFGLLYGAGPRKMKEWLSK